MDTKVLGAIQDRQDTKSLHQELDGVVEDILRGQFKANCPNYHQVRYIPRRCPINPAFGIGLNLLSQIITRSGFRYSHLFFNHDIKLYTNRERDINSLIHITINTYALPVIRYPIDITSWPNEHIKATEIKTRKLLFIRGELHSNQAPWGCRLNGKREADHPRWKSQNQQYIRKIALKDSPER